MSKQLFFIKWKLLLIFFLHSFCAVSQKNFSILNFTTKNGLPENNVQTLLMDKEGFLWSSYGNGVLRFDGQNFRKFFTSDVPYITLYLYKTLADEILVVDASGSIFRIATYHQDTLRMGSVNSLNYLIVKGTIPTTDFYLQYTTPHINKARDRNWFYSPATIFPISKQDCIVRTKKGIGWYRDKILQKEIDLKSYSPEHFIRIEGNIYFFSGDNKLFRLDAKNWKIQPCTVTGDLLKDKFFISPASAISNTFWDYNNSDPCVLIGDNLYYLNAETNNPSDIKSELITNQVPGNCLITSIIYNSKKRILAIGTDTKGLFIFKENNFKTLVYQNPEEGTNNAYYCQLELDSHRLFTDWNREFTIHGGVKSNFPVKKNYSENIFRDHNGFLWYEQNNDLIKYDHIKNIYKTIYNPKKEFALCYFEEGDSMWIGTYKSIAYVKNDSVKVVQQLYNNESNSNIFQIFRWDDNKIWICNYTGIFKYDVKTQHIDTLQAMYLKYPYNITFYRDFMMIGTYGRGYYFYKGGKTVRMPADKNNYLQQVHTFVNDSSGFTWMATNNGLFKTRFADLVKYFNDTISKVFFIHYGEEDGISNPEFDGGCIPSHLVLKNGYVSIPNVEGLVWFKPGEVIDANADSPFIIDAVYFDDHPATTSSSVQLPTSVQSVRIEFTNSYWGNSENLLLEYKLEGFNKQWIALNNSENSVEFSNLHSGRYSFLLRKKNGFEPEKYVTSQLNIFVEKKFYEKTWFILLCILGGGLFVAGVARLYAYNIKQKNIVLEENVRQRTIDLSKANEALQRSVNVKDKLISIISHDIVTPLRFITMVARKGGDKSNTLQTENLRGVLQDIKNTSEKLHDNAQNILNWIKHQNQRITLNKTNVAVSVLADDVSEMLREISAAKETVIINNISPDDVIKTDTNILSIIFHNLISNAAKFTEKGTIELNAKQDDKNYYITVEDTGPGMSAQQLKQIQQIIITKQPVTGKDPSTGEKGYGLGYLIISELIELLKGSINVESTIGRGTKVTLTIRLAVGS